MPDKKEERTVHFKLGDNRAKWATPDGSIKLNRFTGELYGTVTSADEMNFRRVVVAINNGFLIDTKKEMKDKVAEKEEIVDLTNIAEENAKHRTEATQFLRKLHKEDLIEKIKTLKNPYLIAAMIEQESRGRNVSKRRRDDIIDALKARLEEVGKNVKSVAAMFNYLEQSNEGYKVTKDKDTEGQDF